jgi:hypothetical protein
MSKKRFTDGLESLLSTPTEEAALQGHAILSAESSSSKRGGSSAEAPAGEGHKKSQGKRFTDDLQSFLMEAFEESFERQMQQERNGNSPEPEIKKRSAKPMEGLDALIRSTVEPRVQFDQHSMRRLTVQFDERKLEKLKTIARMEKTLLRDIIDSIVEEYISRWEKEKRE